MSHALADIAAHGAFGKMHPCGLCLRPAPNYPNLSYESAGAMSSVEATKTRGELLQQGHLVSGDSRTTPAQHRQKNPSFQVSIYEPLHCIWILRNR